MGLDINSLKMLLKYNKILWADYACWAINEHMPFNYDAPAKRKWFRINIDIDGNMDVNSLYPFNIFNLDTT
jgi:hypothetical protein